MIQLMRPVTIALGTGVKVMCLLKKKVYDTADETSHYSIRDRG